MIIKRYNCEDDWMADRRAKITGTRLKDLISKKGEKKKAYYELISERIAISPDTENVMDRGHRLQDIAIERYETETGKSVDKSLVMWQREDNPDIACSPDGYIEDEKLGIEVKCLNSAAHCEAWLTKDIPNEYRYQIIQYYCTNDQLEALDMIFYDPRMSVKDFFFLHTTREELADEIAYALDYQRKELADVEAAVKLMTF